MLWKILETDRPLVPISCCWKLLALDPSERPNCSVRLTEPPNSGGSVSSAEPPNHGGSVNRTQTEPIFRFHHRFFVILLKNFSYEIWFGFWRYFRDPKGQFVQKYFNFKPRIRPPIFSLQYCEVKTPRATPALPARLSFCMWSLGYPNRW